jgi:hypothetical protein
MVKTSMSEIFLHRTLTDAEGFAGPLPTSASVAQTSGDSSIGRDWTVRTLETVVSDRTSQPGAVRRLPAAAVLETGRDEQAPAPASHPLHCQ